jgi:hypothetical protein
MSILTKKAVLVSLSVSGWNARKRDERGSAAVHEKFSAEKDSGNYNKCLFDVKDKAWVRIVQAKTALDTYHYTHTLPWVHKGPQILLASMYLDYNAGIEPLLQERQDAAHDFILGGHYERLKEQAKYDDKSKRGRLGGLYRESDYPDAGELMHKFRSSVHFMPVPDSGHLAVDLQNSEVKRIKADTDAMIEEAVAKAQREVWDRLFEPVNNMAVALSDPDKRFQDSLVSNVKDIVKLTTPMNLTGDPKLTAMVEEVKKNLTKASPDRLRDDEHLRAEQGAKAAALAKKMRSLMPRAA